MLENSLNQQRLFKKAGNDLKRILMENEDINVTFLKVSDVYYGLDRPILA